MSMDFINFNNMVFFSKTFFFVLGRNWRGKKSCSIRKKKLTKPINRDNLSYPSKLVSHFNSIERQNKKKIDIIIIVITITIIITIDITIIVNTIITIIVVIVILVIIITLASIIIIIVIIVIIITTTLLSLL